MPPRPLNVYDLEWKSVLQSGRLREVWQELKQQVAQLTRERDELNTQLASLRATRAAPVPAAAIPRQESPPQVRTLPPQPAPAVSPPPAVIQTDEPERILDDSATRFGLLELD